MLTSDKVKILIVLAVFFLFPTIVRSQDLGVRVDPDAYSSARSNYKGVYLHIVYEPASTGPNSSSVFNLIEYTGSRPSDFNTVARLGFQSASGAVTERYILADGDSLLLANLDPGSGVVAAINSNLERFNLSTKSERSAVIELIEREINGAEVPFIRFVSTSFYDQLISTVKIWLVIGLVLILAVFVVHKGLRFIFRLARVVSELDRKLER